MLESIYINHCNSDQEAGGDADAPPVRSVSVYGTKGHGFRFVKNWFYDFGTKTAGVNDFCSVIDFFQQDIPFRKPFPVVPWLSELNRLR